MGSFKATRLEKITWDVQGAPKLDPETGKVDGKFLNGDALATGELPEPDPEVVERFGKAFIAEIQHMKDLTIDNLPDDEYRESRKRAEDILADVGFPRELLEHLAPRWFRAFCDWAYDEIVGEAVAVG